MKICVKESKNDDETDDGEVEESEDVVEPRGLFHADTEYCSEKGNSNSF